MRWLRHRECPCGHSHEAHQHYRAGSDCGLCPCQQWGARPVPAVPDILDAIMRGDLYEGDYRGSEQ